jgi:tetratricopeptide (TPR) repeat protein
MSQRNLQIAVVSVSVLLFAFLYFGGRTTPKSRSDIEKTRALQAESSTSIDMIISSAKADLTKEQLVNIVEIESGLPLQLTDSLRAESYKGLSREWNSLSRFDIGGIYAQKVAEIFDTEESWSITGTTFGMGQKNAADEKVRTFCVEQAVTAFNKAIELNPNEVQHKINLALVYVETSQPMQGISMLRDLANKNPKNTSVLLALGQLSVRSGQYDKAIERYQEVVTIEANNLRAYYALAQLYQSLGRTEDAVKAYNKCLEISDDDKFKSDIQQNIKKLKSN